MTNQAICIALVLVDPPPHHTCVFAFLAWSMEGLLTAALALRLKAPPVTATDSAEGENWALPVTLLAGAAQSTRVAGATWLPDRLPRTLRGPAPDSTAHAAGAGEPAGAWGSRGRGVCVVGCGGGLVRYILTKTS